MSKQIYLFSIFDDNQFNNQLSRNLEFTGNDIINCEIFIMKESQLYISYQSHMISIGDNDERKK